jgi:uncharacterized protein (DUF2235 family)
MKRLAIFLDGTWNALNNNTNVWRLKSLTAETAEQRVYYSQGVGTQRGEAARGGITGWGIDDEIIEAYTWLIQNFDEGDEIFVFGFSRGAYTARSLPGLICKCGVLKLGAPLSIEQLYARYRIYDAPTIRTLLAKPLPHDASIEEQWLTKFSRPTKVKFVGVWDTVGSLGLPVASAAGKIRRYRFLTRICGSTTSTGSTRSRWTNTGTTSNRRSGPGPSRPGRAPLRIVRSSTWSSAGSSARTRTSAEDMRATRWRSGR